MNKQQKYQMVAAAQEMIDLTVNLQAQNERLLSALMRIEQSPDNGGEIAHTALMREGKAR